MNSQNKEFAAQDAEYQYGDEQGKSAYVAEAEAEPRPGLGERLGRFLPKNKKMTIIIAILAIAFIAFKMFGPGNKAVVRPPAEQAVNQELSTAGIPQAAQAEQVAPIAPKELLAAPAPAATETAEVKALERSIQETNQSLKNLQAAITVLANSVIQVSDRVQVLEESEAARQKAAKPNAAPAYDLQSLAPGRAWLHSEKGPFVSVKVGDALAGYGKIEEIDPDGRVLTSSGKVITYGSNDS